MSTKEIPAAKLPAVLGQRFGRGEDQLARLRGSLMSAGSLPGTKRGAGARSHTPRDAGGLLIPLALEATPATAASELRAYQELRFRGWAHGRPFFVDADAGDAEARMAVRDAMDLLAQIVDRGRGPRRETLIEFLERLLADSDLQAELAALSENFERLGGGLSLNINLLGGEPRAEVTFGAHIKCDYAAVAGFGTGVFADARNPQLGGPAPRVRGQITLDDLMAVASLMRGDGDAGE